MLATGNQRISTRHGRRRHRHSLQPRSRVDPRSGLRRAFWRDAKHGRVSDRVSRAEHVARSLCRRRAFHRLCHNILAPHRDGWRPIGVAAGEQGRDADGHLHERGHASGRRFRARAHSHSRARFSGRESGAHVLLTRIMFPFILLVSLAALVMGMLNAKNVFGMPAMASSFFNLGSIIGGVALCYWLDPQADWRHPHFGERGLIGLAIGTLIGGLLQLVVQFPSLRRVGFRFRPDFNWRDPGVKTILALMGPATIAASAVQVNVAVNSGFASGLGDGPMTWLNIAFRLMQLPLGIFGVAVATVTLPLVSRSAAVGNTQEFRSAIAHALRLVLLLTIPSAIGLIILANPIISLIYEHGRFHGGATAQTAAALRFYAIGLGRLCGGESAGAGFLCAGQAEPAHAGESIVDLDKLRAQLVSDLALEIGTSRPRAFHQSGRDHEFRSALFDDATLRRTSRDRRDVQVIDQTASRRRALLAAICWFANEYFLLSVHELPHRKKIVDLSITIVVAAPYFLGPRICCA